MNGLLKDTRRFYERERREGETLADVPARFAAEHRAEIGGYNSDHYHTVAAEDFERDAETLRDERAKLEKNRSDLIRAARVVPEFAAGVEERGECEDCDSVDVPVRNYAYSPQVGVWQCRDCREKNGPAMEAEAAEWTEVKAVKGSKAREESESSQMRAMLAAEGVMLDNEGLFDGLVSDVEAVFYNLT